MNGNIIGIDTNYKFIAYSIINIDILEGDKCI